jgi:cytochrome b
MNTPPSSDKKILVWDLPTRLFHGLLAAGFIAAAVLALGTDEHGPLFPLHVPVGLSLVFLVFLRILYGFVGTKHARFLSFLFSPRAVLRYIQTSLRGTDEPYPGHNPGAAYGIFAMLGTLLGLGVTGVLLGRGRHGVEEAHEFLAYLMVALAVLHVLGVVWHTVRHRENIAASMLHGRKAVPAEAAIVSSRPFLAILFLALVGAWGRKLLQGYDATARTIHIPFIGTTLTVGDADHGDEHTQIHDDERPSPGNRPPGPHRPDDAWKQRNGGSGSTNSANPWSMIHRL